MSLSRKQRLALYILYLSLL